MKKKLLSALLAALLVLSMIPFAFAGTVAATEPGTDRVVYLDDTGSDETGDGSKEAPYQTFRTAYRSLCPEGGTIKILNNYGSVADVNKKAITDLRVHYGMITVTGETPASVWQLTSTIKFAGPVTIESITLFSPSQSFIFANLSKLTMGKGIVCQKTSGTDLAANEGGNITIGGFTANPEHNDYVRSYYDSWVTIKSGNYRAVCGGAYFGKDLQITSLGTAYVFVEGGYIANAFATNWGTNANNGPGGNGYFYVSGGSIETFWFGSQFAKQAAINDSFLFWTDGTIGTVRAEWTKGRCTVFYGDKVSLTDTYSTTTRLTGSGKSARVSNVFTASGVLGDAVTCADMNLVPLRSGENQVVYINNGATNNPGTQEAPAWSLSQAIGLLAFSGGEIILETDYTFRNTELTQNCRFNEPYHSGDIVIKGANPDIRLIGPEVQERTVTVSNIPYQVRWGLDLYNLRGNTTFKDLTFDFEHLSFPKADDPTKTERTSVTIAANFYNLVIDTGVKNGGEVCLVGGMDAQPYNHFAPFAHVEMSGDKLNGYSTAGVTYYEPYAFWPAENSDTHITVNSNSGRWWISGFSRIAGWVTLPTSAFNVNYPGTAHITVNGGTVTKLYTSPTNKIGATGGNAVVAINGGSVTKLYDGGANAGFGAVAGNLDITVGKNATVQEYVNINTAPASFTMKVNNAWSSYLIAKNTYTQANVTTDITADTYRDSIDTVLGFRLKDNGDNGVKIQYGVKLKDYIIDDENFQVKEFGVLVKSANNAAALEWFDGSDQVNYQNKVAKNAAYIRGTAIKNYHYNPEAGTNDVEYYSTLSKLSEAKYENSYVFRPYMVVTVNGEDQVVYGAQETRSAYTIAQASGSTNETAAKVLTAVDGAEG